MFWKIQEKKKLSLIAENCKHLCFVHEFILKDRSGSTALKLVKMIGSVIQTLWSFVMSLLCLIAWSYIIAISFTFLSKVTMFCCGA